MSRLAWTGWLLTLLLLLVGCRPKQLEIDEVRFYKEVEARAEQAASAPAVDAQLEALLEAMAADPAIAASGERVLAAIGSDPSLAPSFEGILEKVGSAPTVVARVQKLMRDNPSLSPEQVGEHFEKRVAVVTDGPVFDQAWDREFDVLLAKPSVHAAFRRFAEQLGRNEHVSRAVRNAVQGRVSDANWYVRLEKLNGGKALDKARATDLLLDTAFSKERFERFYGEMFALPVVTTQAAQLVKALLDAPSFTKHATKAVRLVVTDPPFQQHALDGMLLLLEDSPTQPAVDGALRKLFAEPAVATAITVFVDDVLADEELDKIGDRALAAIAADEAFTATVVRLVDGW